MEDTIFWYKAEIHGEFKMGAPELWRQSEMMARMKDQDGGGEEFNPQSAQRLKGPAINVNKRF